MERILEKLAQLNMTQENQTKLAELLQTGKKHMSVEGIWEEGKLTFAEIEN